MLELAAAGWAIGEEMVDSASERRSSLHNVEVVRAMADFGLGIADEESPLHASDEEEYGGFGEPGI